MVSRSEFYDYEAYVKKISGAPVHYGRYLHAGGALLRPSGLYRPEDLPPVRLPGRETFLSRGQL